MSQPNPQHLAPTPHLLAAMLAVAATLFGCGSGDGQTQPSSDPAPRPAVTRTLTQRLDAVSGSPLVLPVEDSLGRISARTRVTLDDGTPVPASLHRVLVHVSLPGPGDTAPDEWMPVPGVWSSVKVDERGDVPTGVAVLLLDLPPEAEGQGLVIDGRRFAVNWIPGPSRLPNAEPGSEVDPWRPAAASDAPGRTFLLSAAVPEARNPLTRWRYRLLTTGLRPTAGDEVKFEDPIIETIARQNEDRWRVALSRLWAADQDLSWRLKQRLCAFANFPDGRAVPTWCTDHASLDRLLTDLLDPLLSPAQRMGKAEIWLTEQPQMVGWISDDGGVLDAARNVVAIGGVANLSARTTMAWGERSDSPGQPDLLPLKPWSVTEVAVPLAPVMNETGDHSVAVSIAVNAGKFSSELPVLPGRLPVTPPGLRLENFVPDWTLPTWTGAEQVRVRPEWSTRALLYQVPSEGNESATGSIARWELFVQCSRAASIGDESHECVRVFIGPADKPRAVLRVAIDGQVVTEGVEAELAPTRTTEIARSPDRWSFRLLLPASAVEPDGTIRLGVTRVDAALRRTTWPRASFPWQTSPARAAINTLSWDRSER